MPSALTSTSPSMSASDSSVPSVSHSGMNEWPAPTTRTLRACRTSAASSASVFGRAISAAPAERYPTSWTTPPSAILRLRAAEQDRRPRGGFRRARSGLPRSASRRLRSRIPPSSAAAATAPCGRRWQSQAGSTKSSTSKATGRRPIKAAGRGRWAVGLDLDRIAVAQRRLAAGAGNGRAGAAKSSTRPGVDAIAPAEQPLAGDARTLFAGRLTRPNCSRGRGLHYWRPRSECRCGEPWEIGDVDQSQHLSPDPLQIRPAGGAGAADHPAAACPAFADAGDLAFAEGLARQAFRELPAGPLWQLAGAVSSFPSRCAS